MANFSAELLNKLEGFFVNSIADKVLDGVTYIMVFSDEQKMFNAYNKIREEVDELGYDKNTLFRVYQFCNGYVFDMDLSVSIYLAEKIVKENVAEAGESNTNIKVNISDMIKDKRKSAMVSFAKYCKSQMDKGITEFDVAMYSRNTVPKILISGKDTNGNPLMLQYRAFPLRHWDIDTVSNELLLPNGVRISKVESCEILPARNGVRFKIYLSRVI